MKKLLLSILVALAVASCALQPEWNSTPVMRIHFLHDSISELGDTVFVPFGDTADAHIQLLSNYNHLLYFESVYDSTLLSVYVPEQNDSTGRHISYNDGRNYSFFHYLLSPLKADTTFSILMTVKSDAEFSDSLRAFSSSVIYVHCENVSPSK